MIPFNRSTNNNINKYYIPTDHIPILIKLCIGQKCIQINYDIKLLQKDIFNTTIYVYNNTSNIQLKYIKYKMKYLKLKKYLKSICA